MHLAYMLCLLSHLDIQVGSHTPNFNTMVGNPLCKQIPWDVDQTRLLAWKEGRTGYPWWVGCF